MDQNKVFRSYPTVAIILALVFIGMGLFILTTPNGLLISLFTFVIGAVILLTASVSTVTIDPSAGKMEVKNQSILRKSIVEIQNSDLQTIEIESHTTRSVKDHTRSTNFRVIARKKDGSVVPIQSMYGNNLMAVNKFCSELRAALNVNDPETPQGLIQNLAGTQMEKVRQKLEEEQETLTGESDEVHETDGIHWQLITRATGGTPISRWQSADFTLPDHFIYLAQKIHGSKDMSGGFLAGLAKTMYVQSMTIYGITDAHAPGMQNGTIFDSIEARIDPDFGGYGDSISVLRQVINIYAVQALESWARKRPLKQGSVQLAVLIGPKGVFVSTIGLVKPDFLQEMTEFGVELVKSIKTGV